MYGFQDTLDTNVDLGDRPNLVAKFAFRLGAHLLNTRRGFRLGAHLPNTRRGFKRDAANLLNTLWESGL